MAFQSYTYIPNFQNIHNFFFHFICRQIALVARVGPQLETYPSRTLLECLGTRLEESSWESITEKFIKILWFHRKWTSSLLIHEFLWNDPQEIYGGCNLRINT